MLFEARSHYDHEGVAVSRLSSLCLALDIVSCCLPPFGEPRPSLYKLEGWVTCGVLVGLGLVYFFLKVEYKSGSCFLVKEIFVIPFLFKPAHHKREPAFWALGLVIHLKHPPGHP